MIPYIGIIHAMLETLPMTTAVNTPVQALTVDARHSGQRIDNYLLSQLKGVPRSHIYRILRTGEVRVNKGRAKPTYKVQDGDVVRVPPLHLPVSPEASPPPKALAALTTAILFEDEHLLILDKPAGLAVHGGTQIRWGVIELLKAARPHQPTLELAHRLDRDTSGCLMLAKSRPALLALHQALQGDEIRKCYLALMRGAWPGGEQHVTAPLQRDRLQGGERLSQVTAAGKSAVTIFRPRQIWSAGSLIEAEILTGRTHQIRAHAAHIQHPIAGDTKYGDKEFNAQLRRLGLRRLFLHAHQIELRHPLTRQRLTLQAPLPTDLAAVVARCASFANEILCPPTRP